VNDYSVTFRRLTTFLGAEREFEEITSADVDEFLNYLSEELGLSGKTVCNAWTALSALWTWAERQEGIKHVLRGRVERPAYRRPPVEPFTEEEVRLLLEGCEHMNAWDRRHETHVEGDRPTALRDRAMILVMVDCGLRVSELCDLRIRDYVAKRGQLTIEHGKGDKKRTISIANVARQAVWRYLKTRPKAKPDEYLFVTRTGQRLDRTGVRAIVMRAGERAGVERAYPHRLRHTFAIAFLRNGGNLLALQAILGHEKMDTVRIYARLAATDLHAAQLGASPADRWNL
jgi:integrase/recombinase XerD